MTLRIKLRQKLNVFHNSELVNITHMAENQRGEGDETFVNCLICLFLNLVCHSSEKGNNLPIQLSLHTFTTIIAMLHNPTQTRLLPTLLVFNRYRRVRLNRAVPLIRKFCGRPPLVLFKLFNSQSPLKTHIRARTLALMRQYKGNDVKASLASGHFVIWFLAGVTSHDNFVEMSWNRYRTRVVFQPSVNTKMIIFNNYY